MNTDHVLVGLIGLFVSIAVVGVLVALFRGYEEDGDE